MPTISIRRFSLRRLRIAAFAALLCPIALRAQSVLGVGDDAYTLAGGVLRIRVSSEWTRFYERYGMGTPGRKNGSVEPLGIDFNLDTLGVAQFANLASVQADVRTLTGMPDFTASLAKTVMRLRDNVLSTPVGIEIGVTRRVTVGVVVPFVTATSDVDLRVNPPGYLPTVGFNPTLAATTGAAAIAANAALLAQFDSAAAQLGRQLSACSGNPSAPGCAALAGNPGVAQALIQSSNAFAAGLAQLYGGRNGARGALFVPVAGSAAEAAIAAHIAAFRARYQSYGTPVIGGTLPLAAAPMTIGDLQALLTDTTFGVRGRPVATTVRRGIGDIDFTLKLNVFDSFGGNRRSRLSPSGFNWRQSVSGRYCLGTGSLPQPGDFVGLGTGTHQNAVEVRSYTDLLFGRHFWLSVSAGLDRHVADEIPMRIADAPSQVLPPAFREQTVRRLLGDVVDVQVNPRWVLNDYLSLAGHYYYRHKAADQYSGTFQATDLAGQTVSLDAATLSLETEAVEHRFGGGVSYSTVAAVERGKARVPIDISYFHYETTLGSGGAVPKLNVDQVQVRWYPRLFGH